MAEGQLPRSQSSSTIEETVAPSPRSPTLVLKLKKPEPDKKVKWDENTAIDNEHMNKKKSKCCCVYEKPRDFSQRLQDSDDDDDDHCTEHCRGHRNKDYRHAADNDASSSGSGGGAGSGGSHGPTRDSGSGV